MHFRKVRESDLASLNALSLASKSYWNYPEAWIDLWREELLLKKSDLDMMDILVLEKDQELIGFCAMKDQKEYYEIIHLWLLPPFIGKGYGKLLFDAALREFALEKKPLRVTADPNAVNFYQRQGFAIIDQVESLPKGRFLPVMKCETIPVT